MTGDATNEEGTQAMDGERERSRRDVLKAAGLAAGALVGGSLLVPDGASAGTGDNQPFTLGAANSATSRTSLSQSGSTIASDGALSVSAAGADYGIYGTGTKYGLVGSGPGGVLGLGTVGGVFSGSVVAVNLDPLGTAGPPSGEAFKGDLAVDSAGVLWLCLANGTPGTWIRVSHGGSRMLATPVRAYDSRYPAQYTNGSNTGKLGATDGTTGNPRTVQIAGFVSAVPTNAVGVIGNLTVTQEEGTSFATIWPEGAWPGTSSINYLPNVDVANGFSVGLGGTGAVSLASWVPTHVIVDITGYIL